MVRTAQRAKCWSHPSFKTRLAFRSHPCTEMSRGGSGNKPLADIGHADTGGLVRTTVAYAIGNVSGVADDFPDGGPGPLNMDDYREPSHTDQQPAEADAGIEHCRTYVSPDKQLPPHLHPARALHGSKMRHAQRHGGYVGFVDQEDFGVSREG